MTSSLVFRRLTRIATGRIVPGREKAASLYKRLYSSVAPATPLEQIIHNSIKATGPISVASYVQLCLSHPVHGYYMTGDPLGVAGDFITSPEISQVFGELMAIWFLSTLSGQRSDGTHPKRVRLVELGPGRGTLTNDILRVLTGPLAQSTNIKLDSVHLVETSPSLQAKQRDTLSQYVQPSPAGASAQQPANRSPTPIEITWHNHINDVPKVMQEDVGTLVIANEFFDALPIHVFEKAPDGWHEVLVDITVQGGNYTHTARSTAKSSPFHFTLSASPVPVPALSSNARFSSLPTGTRVEFSRGSMSVMRTMGELIAPGITKGGGGLGLIIDYGADHFYSNSLRGIRKHQVVGPFDEPGLCDLTSNVDFATLRDALSGIEGVRTHGPIRQRDFLLRMGLEARLAILMRQNKEEGKRIQDGGLRLVDEGVDGMGVKFQVMGLTGRPHTGSSSLTTTATYPF